MSNYELTDQERLKLINIGKENLRNLGPVDPEVAADIGYVPSDDLTEYISGIPEHRAQIVAALGQTVVRPEATTSTVVPEADSNKTWNVNWSDQTPEDRAAAEASFNLYHEIVAAKKQQ